MFNLDNENNRQERPPYLFPHESEALDLSMQIVLLAGMLEKINEYKERNPFTPDLEDQVIALEKGYIDEDKIEQLMGFLAAVRARQKEISFMSAEDYAVIEQAYKALDTTYSEFLRDDFALRDYKTAEEEVMKVDIVKLKQIIENDIIQKN